MAAQKVMMMVAERELLLEWKRGKMLVEWLALRSVENLVQWWVELRENLMVV